MGTDFFGFRVFRQSQRRPAAFTSDAEDEARRQEKRRIMLVDLKRLFDLWVEHYDKIPEVQCRRLPIRPVYFLIPSE